jgi:hypothetical protein
VLERTLLLSPPVDLGPTLELLYAREEIVVTVINLLSKRCVEQIVLGAEAGVLGDHCVVLVKLLKMVAAEFADLMLQMAELAGCAVCLLDNLDEAEGELVRCPR